MTFFVCATPYVSANVMPIIATRLHAPAAFARRRNAICDRTMASFAPSGLILKPITMLATTGMMNTNTMAMTI